MDNRNCGYDCAADCTDLECRFVYELGDGRVVNVSCRGKCSGRCAGRLEGCPDAAEPPPADVKPDRASRFKVRSRRLYVEPCADSREGAEFEVSCAVGCFASHAASVTGGPADCYGSCLGICYGVANVRDAVAASTQRRER